MTVKGGLVCYAHYLESWLANIDMDDWYCGNISLDEDFEVNNNVMCFEIAQLVQCDYAEAQTESLTLVL